MAIAGHHTDILEDEATEQGLTLDEYLDKLEKEMREDEDSKSKQMDPEQT